jgi:hypothetical protein
LRRQHPLRHGCRTHSRHVRRPSAHRATILVESKRARHRIELQPDHEDISDAARNHGKWILRHFASNLVGGRILQEYAKQAAADQRCVGFAVVVPVDAVVAFAPV